MSYSVKKAGVAFKTKLGTNADLTGQAANFSAYYIKDSDGTKTDITEAFTEDANTAGLYMVETIIPSVGDYTIVINNATIGMGNHEAPVVVVAATIDDVKTVVDDLTTTLATVAADVDGLNGQDLQDIKTHLDDISALINTNGNTLVFPNDLTSQIAVGDTLSGNDSEATGTVTSITYDAGTEKTTVLVENVIGDFDAGEETNANGAAVHGFIETVTGTPLDSLMEFVSDINKSLLSGTSGLAALKGYTDDIENMLVGTEFLADGVTANPFYDATNPGVAKESSLFAKFQDLTTSLGDVQTALETKINDAQTSIEAKSDAVKAVVDANKALLEDAGFGLSALKTLIDDVNTAVAAGKTDILDVLNDAANGLAAIKSELVTRFDSVDSKLIEIEDKVDGGNSTTKFSIFA